MSALGKFWRACRTTRKRKMASFTLFCRGRLAKLRSPAMCRNAPCWTPSKNCAVCHAVDGFGESRSTYAGNSRAVHWENPGLCSRAGRHQGATGDRRQTQESDVRADSLATEVAIGSGEVVDR